MEYNELYAAWKKEKENAEIQTLPRGFYNRLTGYVKKILEERRMLDEKSTKAKLLQREFKNVKSLVEDLVETRFKKYLRLTVAGKALPKDALTEEEDRIQEELQASFDLNRGLLKDIYRGREPSVKSVRKPKKVVVRLRLDIPALIGSDLKTYGPFKSEDIATLPLGNARALIEKGAAVEVEGK